MCPICGRLLKGCLCLGLVICLHCHMLKEPMDKHDHPKAPKAENTVTYNYATIMTSTKATMTTTIMATI